MSEKGDIELMQKLAIEAIKRERQYQDWKWGSVSINPHSVGEWLLILERELLEAKEAWCKNGGDQAALMEILQVGAVAVACMEQHGYIERNYPAYHTEF